MDTAYITCVALTTLPLLLCATGAQGREPIDIGSRLELFVEDSLVDEVSGDAELVLHRPVEREVAIVHDRPWEGNASLYHTIFRDGDLYRMYYRGSGYQIVDGGLAFRHKQVVCYAESDDGIHWRKPNLGIVQFDGSTQNNIIWDGVGCHCFVPFKDANPACKPQEKYKAFGQHGAGLITYKSADGIHWSIMSKEPVITEGAFDSQNLAFWDTVRGEYRDYHRGFREGRDILTCTSKDFVHWTKPQWLSYTPDRTTELYTNQIIPYDRAPHIFLGFPTRYVPARYPITEIGEQLAGVTKRLGTDYSDGGFIASRDGNTFKVWQEAFIRPGPEPMGRWVYGDNYQNWGILQTASDIPGAPDELSVYASEGYWRGDSNQLRRYTLRIDGFVSLNAPLSGGEVVTRPIVFNGSALVVNFATSAAGSLRVELQSADGAALPGLSLEDCPVLFGDRIEGEVRWAGGGDISAHAGKPVRLRFALKDADLYSFRFR